MPSQNTVSLFGLQGVSRSSFSELWNEVRQISIAGVFCFLNKIQYASEGRTLQQTADRKFLLIYYAHYSSNSHYHYQLYLYTRSFIHLHSGWSGWRCALTLSPKHLADGRWKVYHQWPIPRMCSKVSGVTAGLLATFGQLGAEFSPFFPTYQLPDLAKLNVRPRCHCKPCRCASSDKTWA